MNWSDTCAERLDVDVPLGPLTSYRVGGPARYLYSPQNADDLKAIARNARNADLPLKVLGRGANVLIRDDGFDGVVVRLESDGFRSMRFEGTRVLVGAGCDLTKLCKAAAQQGLAGLECLVGIPGTVGGAIRMNAGGKFGCIGDAVDRFDVLTPDGRVESRSRVQARFGYRSCDIGDSIVLGAELVLEQQSRTEVWARYREYWAYKKRTQPLADRSAGCVFKNPPGESAGRLIDQAGLKGERCGGAVVSTQHANFISADRNAEAGDVLRLIDRIRERVSRKFGQDLELEIDVW